MTVHVCTHHWRQRQMVFSSFNSKGEKTIFQSCEDESYHEMPSRGQQLEKVMCRVGRIFNKVEELAVVCG